MNSIVCTLLLLFSSSAALKISAKPNRPELVQLLANPGQGSTALGQLLMSSTNVATLCRAETWQCEPCNLMGGDNDLCTGTDMYSLRNAVDIWSKYWDLSRPLLLKKSLFDVMRHSVVDTHRAYLSMVADGLPRRMQRASIDGLRFAYIVLWRPICISKMSSNFEGVPKEVQNLEYLGNLVENLPREAGARVLAINYASLLWELDKTKKRVEEFLPNAGVLDASFQPRMNIDIFPGNKWKATESILQYGRAHVGDAITRGYNVSQQTCERDEFGEEFAHLRARYEDAVGLLRAKSM
mmetsp:Transcript_68703/g.129648  ORF Transcript_68703/g.129648 Transcript_68703/m.129648 type:complete len:296 (+) Transcript_68703:73-960(+)